MQHNRAGRKLRRSTPHRLAMFSNQLTSFMTHERIETTLTKAKELRPLAEKLITLAKADGVAARFGYTVRYLPVGPEDAGLGAPTQMGVFTRCR